MSRKLLVPILFVCLSVGVSWGWSITSPEINAEYLNSATITCSGTGFPNTVGEVQLKQGSVIMDSKGFTWGEETDWQAGMEPPEGGWPAGVSAVKLYDTSTTPNTLKQSVNIVIIAPE